jgi:hypothetical protein
MGLDIGPGQNMMPFFDNIQGLINICGLSQGKALAMQRFNQGGQDLPLFDYKLGGLEVVHIPTIIEEVIVVIMSRLSPIFIMIIRDFIVGVANTFEMVIMGRPIPHTDPTKLEITVSASHVVATLVFLD